jgi:glucose/arabinose dehydrogenase
MYRGEIAGLCCQRAEVASDRVTCSVQERKLKNLRGGLLPTLPIVSVLTAFTCAAPAQAFPGAADAAAGILSEFTPVEIAGSLELPWSIGFLPDGAILVTEKPGRLLLIREGSGVQPVSGVPPVLSGLHAGLLDIAVDPGFAESGILYLSYSHGDESASTLRVLRARLDLAAHALVDQQIIFESSPPTESLEQLGGRLALTGDGHLLITLGDRGEGARAQDLSDHAGSIIRIRLDGSVPQDNPFVAVPGARPEVWTYGHRNPQGLAIDVLSGQVWSVEHGPQGGDEVNHIEAGRNYGWPVITHGIDYSGEPVGIGNAGPSMEQPLHVWTPSIAPSGLTVERNGDQLVLWVGALAGQMLARLELRDGEVRGEQHLFQGQLRRIRDVRQGPDGMLYVITDDSAGALYRLQPAIAHAEHNDGSEPI